mgnify:CR=1 FL=1
MDIREEINTLYSRAKKLEEVEKEIAFIEKNFSVWDINKNKLVPVKLYEYEKEFLVHIIENNEPFISRKTRQCGITTLYAMHVAYTIKSYLRSNNMRKPFCCYISRTFDECKIFCNKVKDFLEKIGFEGVNIKDYVKLASSYSYKGITIGCAFDEIFVDEFEFFDNFEDIKKVLYIHIANRTKIIATSGINKNKTIQVSYPIKQEIHWWQIPRFNKFLTWVKEIKETLIDEDGSIVYNEERFNHLIECGYKPTSPEYERLREIGLSKEELF